MSRKSSVLSISLPPDLAFDLDSAATVKKRTGQRSSPPICPSRKMEKSPAEGSIESN
jgi:hypothetical protein